MDNKKLYVELSKYIKIYNEAKDLDLPLPKVPEYIGEVIFKISENMAKRPNFSGYSFIEEMKSDGIENCLMYLHNFNPEKYDNPFSYLSTIQYWAFVRRIQKEQKQQYIKYKTMINSTIMNGLVNMPAEDMSHFEGSSFHIDDDKLASLEEKFGPKKKPEKKKKGIEKFVDE